MNQIAKVEIIKVYYLDVFKWLRKEMGMHIKEAKELSKDGQTIDFDGDYKKAIEFYEYLNRCSLNSARLIIDINHDTTTCYGAYVYEGDVRELEKFSNEWKNSQE